MSQKQQIFDLLNWYSEKKAEYRTTVRMLYLDDNRSPELREEMIQDKGREIAAIGKRTYQDIKGIVEAVKAGIANQQLEPGAKLPKGTEYQMQLSNTLEMLRLAAKQMSVDAIQDVIRPFAADTLVIGAFRGVLASSGLQPAEVERIMQPFAASRTLGERLDAFLKSVEVITYESPVNGMELGVASVLFMLSHWNDDMTGWVDT